MRRATFFKFEDRYVIHSESTTVAGYGIASAPYLILDATSPMESLVENLLAAMDASQINVTESNSATSLKDYLKFIGLKTHRELYRNATNCIVYEKDNNITFLPTVNLGISGGFQHLSKSKVEIFSGAGKEDICLALVEALSRCE